ncbi:hypothetical protein [Intrasporangium flavum]|uniref:hypothetical protein n=1 Tax=Intrasporangium flavum TaxID=1428657 RepID=UPI00096D74E6|nr:hypothetical protein [Intrasporangium flavum]
MRGADGDPASISALGGTLRGGAGRLADHVHDLNAPAGRQVRRGEADPTARERDLLTRTATELDAVGGLLQALTAATAESAARLRALEPDLRRAGLLLDGPLVVEAPGPSRVEPDTRLRERARLQELLNRITSTRARELARLRRELERSIGALSRVSDRSRSGT